MSAPERVIINEPDSRSILSLSAWKEMFRELQESRELIHRLWYRDLVGQFKQSFLGILWIVLPPMATTFMFTFLRSANIVNVTMEGEVLPYALFVLIGSTVWQMFSSAAVQVTASIAGAGALVSRIYFPREALAISAFGKALFATGIQACVIILSFFVLGFWPHWEAVFVPVVLLPLAALSIGVGMWFAPFNAVARDIGQALAVLFQFAMFLAPTVYPTPEYSPSVPGRPLNYSNILYWLHTLNPVTHFINATRDLIQYGYLTEPFFYLVAAALSLLVLAAGWRFFHLCEPLVAERI